VMASNRALKVETAQQSKAMLIGVLDGQSGAARDIVLLNAGAALYAANVCDSIAAGIERARGDRQRRGQGQARRTGARDEPHRVMVHDGVVRPPVPPGARGQWGNGRRFTTVAQPVFRWPYARLHALTAPQGPPIL